MALANLVYALPMMAAAVALPSAHYKVSVRHTFLLQSPRTEAAISVVQNEAWTGWSRVYGMVLLALTPFLVRYSRNRPLLIPVVLLIALAAPLWWYFSQVSHVAGKFVDWDQILGPPQDGPLTGD